MSLRLTFGGSPNPAEWSMFSDIVTDLANELIMNKDWTASHLRCPWQSQAPEPKTEPDDVPMMPARPLAVVPSTTTTAKVDVFIDDLIAVILGTPENLQRVPHAVPLAMFLTSRSHAGDSEPLPRRTVLSIPKHLVEGAPAEIQIVLGWLINCRRFLIALPKDKFDEWSKHLCQLLHHRGETNFGNLETLVGRLNHAAAIIPLSRHFLNRLQGRVKTRVSKLTRIQLTEEELEDVKLWKTFLQRAHGGMSIDKVVVL